MRLILGLLLIGAVWAQETTTAGSDDVTDPESTSVTEQSKSGETSETSEGTTEEPESTTLGTTTPETHQ